MQLENIALKEATQTQKASQVFSHLRVLAPNLEMWVYDVEQPWKQVTSKL